MRRFVYIILCVLVGAAAAVAVPASQKNSFARKLHTFNSIVKELQANYVDTLNADKIMDGAIEALLYQIDPYTEYYPAGDQDELLSISQGKYAGIGSVISRYGKNIIINRPQEGAPAQRAGLRPGDVIVAVDGDTLAANVDVGDVSKKLRGQAGTEVKLSLRRPYPADSLFDVTIVRADIKVEALPYFGVDSDGIAYLDLTTFNENSSRSFRHALQQMLEGGNVKGVVVDLRGNGGGLLEAAVQIAANFVPKGTEIVRTQGRDSRDRKIYKTTTQPLERDIPLAVLTDGGSASSSEILAGALQDLDRAVIVGQRSYGKGLVQQPRPLPYGDLMKITTGRYYIPSGRLIQAIDYSRRDEDGAPMRTPDSLTHEFSTAAGRIVRDGGGITPDVTTSVAETNRLMYNIIADYWAFDFANRHVAAHPRPEGSVLVTDSIFEAFKASIDPERFKYDRQCEAALDFLRKAAKIEGYMTDSVAAQFDVLASMLKHNLNHDLDINRKAITDVLDSELASRYYSEAEQVARLLPADSTYQAAKAVLLDQERYRKILSPKK